MTEGQVIDLARQTIWLIVETSAPMLAVSLVVGLIISVFQTVTSIQEQTLTFVPKLLAILAVVAIAGGWIMGNISEFMVNLVSQFHVYIQ